MGRGLGQRWATGGCMRIGTWQSIGSAATRPRSDRARRVRLVAVIVAVTCGALAWQAQAALASSAKLTIVKVNVGGPASDTFDFTTNLSPAAGSFTLTGGHEQTFVVTCNASSSPTSCPHVPKPVQQV